MEPRPDKPDGKSLVVAAITGFIAPAIPMGVVLFAWVFLSRYGLLRVHPETLQSVEGVVVSVTGALVAAGAYYVGHRNGARRRE